MKGGTGEKNEEDDYDDRYMECIWSWRQPTFYLRTVAVIDVVILVVALSVACMPVGTSLNIRDYIRGVTLGSVLSGLKHN